MRKTFQWKHVYCAEFNARFIGLDSHMRFPFFLFGFVLSVTEKHARMRTQMQPHTCFLT